MPEAPVYESHLSIDAVAFVVALPRRRQRQVLDLADQIAMHPFQIGDYQTTDAAGRSIDNLLTRLRQLGVETGYFRMVGVRKLLLERNRPAPKCLWGRPTP